MSDTTKKQWWAYSPEDGWLQIDGSVVPEMQRLLDQGDPTLEGCKLVWVEDYGADLRAVAAMRRPWMLVGSGITDETMERLAVAFANAMGRGFPVDRHWLAPKDDIMFIEQDPPSLTSRTAFSFSR